MRPFISKIGQLVTPLGSAALCLPLLLAAGCTPSNTYVPPPPPTVTVAEPVKEDVTDYLEFTGTVRAAETVELKSRVNGYLQKINFKDGALVKEGELLFVIDKAPYETALNLTKANLKKARAVLQLKEAQLARIRTLARRSAASKEELDVAESERATAEADVSAGEANVRQAELDLSYTEIHAPISGRIGRHQSDIGNLVRMEDTVLATIESVDPIHAYFNVSESIVVDYMENWKPAHRDDRPVFELSLGDSDNYKFKGKLDYSDFGVAAGTGTVLARAVFDNANQELIPGLFVRLRTPRGAPEPKLLVEERAIGSDQRGEYLLVVNKDNVVEYRPIQMGTLHDGLRVIESGISDGDKVIINGLQRARPNGKVTPQPADMKSAIATSMQSHAVKR